MNNLNTIVMKYRPYYYDSCRGLIKHACITKNHIDKDVFIMID